MLTQGPEQLSVLHWPFRFLPYVHLSILLAFAVAATIGGFIVTKRRLACAFAVIALGLLGSAQAQPAEASIELLFAWIVILLLASTVWLGSRSRALDVTPLIAGTAIVFTLTHFMFPQNLNQPDWRQSHAVGQVDDLAAIPSGYSVTAGLIEDVPNGVRPPQFGNMALTSNAASFFGYSPIGLRASSQMFCVRTHGFTCLEVVKPLFSSAIGARTWADLMKIDAVIFLPSTTQIARPRAPPGWECSSDGKQNACHRREPRPHYPGTVSFATVSVVPTSAGVASATHEAMTISAPRGGEIVFARLAWLGYRAVLDGAPLPVQRLGPGLVALQIPPNDRPRTLVLSYGPPGMVLSIGGAASALLLLLGGMLGWSHLGIGVPRMSPRALGGVSS
jgi:hypothetical protein